VPKSNFVESEGQIAIQCMAVNWGGTTYFHFEDGHMGMMPPVRGWLWAWLASKAMQIKPQWLEWMN